MIPYTYSKYFNMNEPQTYVSCQRLKVLSKQPVFARPAGLHINVLQMPPAGSQCHLMLLSLFQAHEHMVFHLGQYCS